MKIGISGIGFVGNAIMESFLEKGYILNINLFIYDKYKLTNSFNELLNTDIVFLALPTQYDTKNQTYNLDPLTENLTMLCNQQYDGIIVIKSTLMPQTIDMLAQKYNLSIVHNPEFL